VADRPESSPAISSRRPLSRVDRPATQRLIVAASTVVACLAALAWFAAPDQQPVPPPAQLLLVDINAASAEELCLLPGIGPVTAHDIVAERRSHGPFASLEEIAHRVHGVGPKTIEACRPYAHVQK